MPFLRLLLLCLWVQILGAAPWSEVRSDLPSDPTVQQGALENGLRYFIKKASEPKDRASLRLVVSVGSLHEKADEQGVAHFLEHMLFTGSKHFPKGSIRSELERLGIDSGSRINAFTGYEYTIFHLELPNTGTQMLEKGMDVFEDFAAGAQLAEEAVEIERKVILSEMKMRDDPQEMARKSNMSFLWPKSRYNVRPILGTSHSVQSMSRAQILTFYKAWYRPERMAVIAVGDFSPEAVEKLIKERLSSLRAQGEARPEPKDGMKPDLSKTDITMTQHEAFMGLELCFEHPFEEKDDEDNLDTRRRYVQRSLAFIMFQSRLAKAVESHKGSIGMPGASFYSPIRGWKVAYFSATCGFASWKLLTRIMDQEYRRAIKYGFTNYELERAKAGFVEGLEEAVRREPIQHAQSQAQAIASHLIYGAPLSSATQWRDRLRPLIEGSDLKACHKAFRKMWGEESPHLFVKANTQAPVFAGLILRALNESYKTPVSKPVEEQRKVFAYDGTAKSGSFVAENRNEALDVWQGSLENGVRLNFKKTPYDPEKLLVSLRVIGGKLSLTKDQAGLDLLAHYGFVSGGLGKHSLLDLQDILSGTSIRFSFQIEMDASVLTLHCTRKDLGLGLKLLGAYLSDPGFDPKLALDARTNYATMYEALFSQPDAGIHSVAEAVIGGDARLCLPPLEFFGRMNFNDMKDWLGPQLAMAPIELAIVGDADWDFVKQEVAASIGTLPEREPFPGKAALNPPEFQATPDKTLFLRPHISPQQTVISWYFPIRQTKDIHLDRRCLLASRCLQQRFVTQIREELGASYAPSVHFVSYDALPGFGYFLMETEVSTVASLKVTETMGAMLDALEKEGISEDEFLRTKEPFLKEREEDLRTNAYWCMTVLSDAQQRPERLLAAKDRLEDSAAITREDVNSILRTWVRASNAFCFQTSLQQAEASSASSKP
jgi:zinc protease